MLLDILNIVKGQRKEGKLVPRVHSGNSMDIKKLTHIYIVFPFHVF